MSALFKHSKRFVRLVNCRVFLWLCHFVWGRTFGGGPKVVLPCSLGMISGLSVRRGLLAVISGSTIGVVGPGNMPALAGWIFWVILLYCDRDTREAFETFYLASRFLREFPISLWGFWSRGELSYYFFQVLWLRGCWLLSGIIIV